MDNTVTISTIELADLIRTQTKYDTLINSIFNNAEISYQNELKFDREKIDTMIQAVEPTRYYNKLRTLKDERDSKEVVE